jgi:hypothetical protein
MDQEFLTTREFERWTRTLDGKVDRILDHQANAVEQQTTFNLDATDRLATLEAKQGASGSQAAKVSSGIAVVVTGILNGIVLWLSSAAAGK